MHAKSQVILWDWRTGKQVGQLVGHQSPVVSVEMSLDGSRLVSGDKDGILIVWDTVKENAYHVSCRPYGVAAPQMQMALRRSATDARAASGLEVGLPCGTLLLRAVSARL